MTNEKIIKLIEKFIECNYKADFECINKVCKECPFYYDADELKVALEQILAELKCVEEK